MARNRMSNADAAWLHMDRASNLMIINAVMWFDEPVDWLRLRELLTERLIDPYPRFRQRPDDRRTPVGALYWQDVPDFDLEEHLVHVRLPAPGDQAALHRYISDQLSHPLDHDRPLWQAHFIDGYEGGAAVYTRIHHAVADGVSLVRLLLSLTDDEPETPLFDALELSEPAGLVRRAKQVVAEAAQTTGHLVHEGFEVLTHPSRVIDLVQFAFRGTRAVGKTLLTPPDYRTVLKGRMGPAKQALWSTPVPLADVKAIGRQAGATVNDVLCAAVTGALHRYLDDHDDLVPDLRAFVPFNLRPLDEPIPRELGNRFGIVFLSLPVGERDRAARLAEVKRRMDAIKASPEGVVGYGVLTVTGMTPVQIERVIVDVFGAKGSLVLTNVAGPKQDVFLAGTRLAGFMGWVPATGGIALGISIFSYCGQVTVGIYADATLVPDPEALVAAFDDEIAAMLATDLSGVVEPV